MTTMARLVEALEQKGALPGEWAATVSAVDRALFIPEVCPGINRGRDEEGWLRAVYDDRPVITQLDDGAAGGRGAPTSSSSQPSLMLQMLGLLDVREGHRVLEIGTATGYNAAWLCHRLGDDAVTTIEIDEALCEQARRSLGAAGYAPAVVCGDGLKGWAAGAPYDRVVSTCTVREVPPALLEQTAGGGRIVTPYGGSFHSYSFLALDVDGGEGRGRFSGSPDFMWARPHRGRAARIADIYHGQDGATGATGIDPRAVAGDADALFFVSLLVADAWPEWHWAKDGSGEATLWLLSDDRRSWATVEYAPDAGEYETDQFGPRRLWDEAEAAWRRWQDLGAPARDRFGLTVTPEGERVWLDEPGQPVGA